MKQKEAFTNYDLSRVFNFWNSGIWLTLDFSASHSLILGIEGSTVLPPQRLLPSITSNIAPRNIAIGNPLLKPAFKNTYFASYSLFSVANDNDISVAGVFNKYFRNFSSVIFISIRKCWLV